MKLSRTQLLAPVLERPERIDTLELAHLRAVAHGLVELLVRRAEKKPAKRKAKPPPVPYQRGDVTLPVFYHIPGFRLGRGGNDRLSMYSAIRQKTNEKRVTRIVLGELAPAVIPPRIRVTLTRICLGGLDSDNLQGAFKYVRDEVARWLGRDDGDPSYEWVYEHRPAKRGVHHVELQIEARP